MRLIRGLMALTVTLALGACANTGLRDLRGTSDGPDEFIVTPSKPLEEPESYSALPTPTPGQANLVDLRPLDESVDKLGGRRGSPTAAIPASDGAVVNHASRFGRTADIRTTLAAEDEAFRKRRGRFTQYRIVPIDRYNQAYKRQAIDAQKVATAYRRAGVPTPSSPPANTRFGN
ncbi:DUF3035 domain-containing protein [Pseudosulfitobacter pseudonitzschiae]|uniref:Beta-barrel assembly machine subunit BamF n=1 Tax=Pseudosulfitobacter pseudonitzschiae TaxID=1402135 RepID=A0A073J6I9_9RHOB|nr:DUF3035 domain-containing protein [Pseudosulfitobacter pseudonitzschiae]KEJ97336.1 hypothetical protein SUH3_11210 [Pseudosulfitobacter pseudonitzschiae]MBM1815891.1 DUF3035 domain-containing protein [Pseudosulfitobacter pseudonitzschiae]MBM1832882.1 DUF3035 domain-containing protein [Pseudosulfitobacter pseudonitzschiae]MBM1837750.1 DUF3035 domain-containing protein [Pseudosulfitobacter pseudonitzschiae]MBM1842596.1 DUF3035 domain-containing protein [Pseudosulfitobacter pseudonitzschiae]